MYRGVDAALTLVRWRRAGPYRRCMQAKELGYVSDLLYVHSSADRIQLLSYMKKFEFLETAGKLNCHSSPSGWYR